MKKLILVILIIPLAFLLKLLSPLYYIFGRVYYTASLISKIKSWDISIKCDGLIKVTGTKNITIGKRCRLGKNSELRTMNGGCIRLGNEIRINRGCIITSYSNISIGDFTIIGEYTSIRDANHGMEKNAPMRYQAHTFAPINIGRDVWLGRGCCVLPDVTIGEGSVIGANSVVTKDIPSFSIAAGVPAKVIGKRE